MRESKIESVVCKYASDHGWLVFKFSAPNHRGVPDRLMIKDGVTVYVEFKAPGKKPTGLQLRTHDKIRKAGATVLIIDDIEQGKKQIKGLKTKC